MCVQLPAVPMMELNRAIVLGAAVDVDAIAGWFAGPHTIATHDDELGRELESRGYTQSRAWMKFERDATDAVLAQGTSAVLDKISAATLLETRQKQDRLQFLTAMIEQLAVDNKRSRDTEVSLLNMQLTRLRASAACGTACPGLLTGSAGALRAWRQP